MPAAVAAVKPSDQKKRSASPACHRGNTRRERGGRKGLTQDAQRLGIGAGLSDVEMLGHQQRHARAIRNAAGMDVAAREVVDRQGMGLAGLLAGLNHTDVHTRNM